MKTTAGLIKSPAELYCRTLSKRNHQERRIQMRKPATRIEPQETTKVAQLQR
jgi:hypothetical protein